MRRFAAPLSFAAFAAAMGFVAITARADTLSVALTTPPLVSANNGTINYDGLGHFSANAIPATLADPTLPGGSVPFTATVHPQMTVDLAVDGSGHFLSSGTGFSLVGSLDLDNDGIDDAIGTLLAGTISAFGTADAGPPSANFDVQFTVQSGLLAQVISLSGGGTRAGGFTLGGSAGATLTADDVTSGTLGDYASSFSSDSVRITAGPLAPAVPLPSAATAGLALLAGTLVRRRRRH